MSDAHRIFVAVPLDARLHDAVAALEKQLESAGARLRWVKPDHLHFTLRFLGHISTDQLSHVRAAAREAAGGAPAFPIRLDGVGAFPSARRPQVVWIGVAEGRERLHNLAAGLDDCLARRGFPRESRDFHAHLTLARTRDPRLWASVGPALASLEGVEVGGQDVTSIVVMESLLRPSGPTYAPVEEVPLLPYEK